MTYPILYQALRDLEDTGADGFEGFTKAILEAFAPQLGFFFLARSGYQGGLDASNVGFSKTWVALECKHYDQKTQLRSVELSGALSLAINNANQQLDLWILATTKAIGANELKDLKATAERECVGIIAIDWQLAGLPRLALMCASQSALTVSELARRLPQLNSTGMQSELAALQAHSSFSEQVDILKKELSSMHMGYDHAASSANAWITQKLMSRQEARTHLNQNLCPLDSNYSAYVERQSVTANLNTWLNNWGKNRSIAVVRGKEGVGKSWSVMKWWQGISTRALTIAVTSNVSLSHHDPLDLLSDLLYRQLKERSPEYWRRCLQRWFKRSPLAAPLIYLIFDGVNEQSREQWEERISSFQGEVYKNHVAIIITTWPDYWRKNIEQNMPIDVPTDFIDVGSFSEAELKEALSNEGIPGDSLSDEVREFIRVPRIFHTAVKEFRHLLSASSLTLERLLIEDWRTRRQYKAGLKHNAREFSEIVIGLAQEIRQGTTEFSAERLRRHSSLARRSPDRNLDRDFDEIIGGQLFESIDDVAGTFRIRPEHVGLSLGMLLAEEVRRAEPSGRAAITSAISQAIDPVRDFSSVNGIVAGAVACACLWQGYPIAGIDQLLEEWMRLRNRSGDHFEDFSAYMADQPEAYLKLAEVVWMDFSSYPDGRQWVSAAILSHLDVPKIFAFIVQYANRWLSSWHTDWHPFLGRPEESRLIAQREKIAQDQNSMSPTEQALFNEYLRRADSADEVFLSDLSFLIISHCPRLPFSTGLFAWALSRTIMGLPTDYEKAAWCLRLNQRDSLETEAALLNLCAMMPASSNGIGTKAINLLQYAIGSETAINGLPEETYQTFYAPLVEASIAALNPNAAMSDTAPLLEAANGINVNEIHSAMGPTIEDSRLRLLIPSLAVSRCNDLTSLIRSIILTAGGRKGVPLRQLSLFTLEHSLLIGEPEILALETALAAIASGNSLLEGGDLQFVESNILMSVLPSLPANQQLGRLLSRPPNSLLRDDIEELLLPIGQEDAIAILGALVAEQNDEKILATLLYLSTQKFQLDVPARAALIGFMQSQNPLIRGVSFKIAKQVGDSEVTNKHVDSDWKYSGTNVFEDFYGTMLLVNNRAKFCYRNVRGRAHPELWGWLAMQDGTKEAIDDFVEDIDSIWHILITQNVADEAQNEMVVMEASQGSEPSFNRVSSTRSLKAVYRASQSLFPQPNNVEDLQEFLNTASFDQKLQREHQQLLDLIAKAREVGSFMFGKVFRSDALQEVIQRRPDILKKWLDELDNDNSTTAIWRAGDFYRSIVMALSHIQPQSAANLLGKLNDAKKFSGRTQFLPLKIDALIYSAFSIAEPQGSLLRNDLINSAYTDEKLFQIALVAQEKGEKNWLLEVINAGVQSNNLYQKARALTLIGFLDESDALEQLKPQLGNHSGFLKRVAENAINRLQSNSNARHWFKEFLNRQQTELAWGALCLTLKCIDRRYHLWNDKLIKDATGFSTRKQHALALNENTISRVISENEDKPEATLFGIKIFSGDLSPWIN